MTIASTGCHPRLVAPLMRRSRRPPTPWPVEARSAKPTGSALAIDLPVRRGLDGVLVDAADIEASRRCRATRRKDQGRAGPNRGCQPLGSPMTETERAFGAHTRNVVEPSSFGWAPNTSYNRRCVPAPRCQASSAEKARLTTGSLRSMNADPELWPPSDPFHGAGRG